MAESRSAFAARRRAQYIEALEQELAGYERYGNVKRAKDVKAQLEIERAAAAEQESAAADRAAAAATGEDVTPTDASPYSEVTLRDLKELAADRGITTAGKTRQDVIEALERADTAATTDAGDDGTSGAPAAPAE